jgi:hypothetical protein
LLSALLSGSRSLSCPVVPPVGVPTGHTAGHRGLVPAIAAAVGHGRVGRRCVGRGREGSGARVVSGEGPAAALESTVVPDERSAVFRTAMLTPSWRGEHSGEAHAQHAVRNGRRRAWTCSPNPASASSPPNPTPLVDLGPGQVLVGHGRASACLRQVFAVPKVVSDDGGFQQSRDHLATTSRFVHCGLRRPRKVMELDAWSDPGGPGSGDALNICHASVRDSVSRPASTSEARQASRPASPQEAVPPTALGANVMIRRTRVAVLIRHLRGRSP